MDSLQISTTSKVDITTVEGLVAHRLNKAVPHYKNVPREARLAWLSDAIIKLNAMKHQTVNVQNMTPDQVIAMDAETLDSYIMDDIYVSDFTFKEIEEAFRMGLVGKYGEYYGINAISLYNFLEGYWKTPKKQKAVSLIREARLRERREAFEKKQRDLARIEGWGMKVATVDEKKLASIGKVDDAEARRKSEEHRKLIKAQCEAIKKQYGVINEVTNSNNL